MRKPITYLNLALLLVALWMVAGIRQTWRRNHGRYALAAPAVKPPSAAPAAAGAPAAVLALPAFSELVVRNPFFPDRNNEEPVIRVERKPTPPLPVVIGTLNLGSGMVALMAEQAKASTGAFRRLKIGDEIGGWTVAEIAEHKVVLSFEDEKKTIDVYESADTVLARGGQGPSIPPPSSGNQVHSAVPSGAPATTATPSAQAAPPQQPTVIPGNPSGFDPTVTWVQEGNCKKYSRPTPFGTQSWYDPGCGPAKPK